MSMGDEPSYPDGPTCVLILAVLLAFICKLLETQFGVTLPSWLP